MVFSAKIYGYLIKNFLSIIKSYNEGGLVHGWKEETKDEKAETETNLKVTD